MATSMKISTALSGSEQSRPAESRGAAAPRTSGVGVGTEAVSGDRVELSLVGRAMGSKAAEKNAPATSAADAARLAAGLRERLQAQPALALAAQAGQTEHRQMRLLTSPLAQGA